MDGRMWTELRVQVVGRCTLPDPEASILKSVEKDEVGAEVELES